MQPIVVTFGGSATSLNILGPDVEEISRSGNTVTINGYLLNQDIQWYN